MNIQSCIHVISTFIWIFTDKDISEAFDLNIWWTNIDCKIGTFTLELFPFEFRHKHICDKLKCIKDMKRKTGFNALLILPIKSKITKQNVFFWFYFDVLYTQTQESLRWHFAYYVLSKLVLLHFGLKHDWKHGYLNKC